MAKTKPAHALKTRPTGLRLDEMTLRRVDHYLVELRRQHGRRGATQAEALRVLVDLGLEAAGVPLDLEGGE